MTDKSYIDQLALSDKAQMKIIGDFIRQNRLEQNKTQEQLAKEAGIVRSTLSLFERGENASMIVFIQLLRTLKLLHLLQAFELKQQISPLQLLKLEQSKRKRAKSTTSKKTKPKSDW